MCRRAQVASLGRIIQSIFAHTPQHFVENCNLGRIDPEKMQASQQLEPRDNECRMSRSFLARQRVAEYDVGMRKHPTTHRLHWLLFWERPGDVLEDARYLGVMLVPEDRHERQHL